MKTVNCDLVKTVDCEEVKAFNCGLVKPVDSEEVKQVDCDHNLKKQRCWSDSLEPLGLWLSDHLTTVIK